ncbi:MAG: hypothetical protein IJ014_06565 [Rikenellaceae bacterium]|nr:hypothetical protein [Rikenellaceae bacterium]
MKNLQKSAAIVAAIFGVCALIHLPYTFLTRLGVIERIPALGVAITCLGVLICVSEVVYFALMLASKLPSKSVKISATMILIVPAISAVVRVCGYFAGVTDGAFAQWWGANAGIISNVSMGASAWAVVWLVWLSTQFRSGSWAMIMSVVAAYETLLNLIVWNFVASTVQIPSGVYLAILVQYYIVWTLFYPAIGCYYKSSDR